MNVLSLFDGISCGQLALRKLGIKVDRYFASEIDKYAIKVVMEHFPNTVQVGDVQHLEGGMFPRIDLMMGGSPCTDLSFAKTDGIGLDGPQSKLFWEYKRLLDEVKPTWFLLENVKMNKRDEDIITEQLGVAPIEINSSLVSAQNRVRLYWTNIEVKSLPEDKGIVIEDIIYDDSYKVFNDERIARTLSKKKNYVQWDMSGKGYNSQQDRAHYRDGKMCTIPRSRATSKLNIVVDGGYRRLHPVEVERLQTVDDNYTCAVSDSKRLELLGNGWTVDVITHILSFMKGE